MESIRKEYPDRIEYLNKEGYSHRLDGPAREYFNGPKCWYVNGLLHREDGLPAVEFKNGRKDWWVNGKLHREDGPAIEYSDGRKEWYLNHTNYSEEQYQTELVKIKLNRLINEKRTSR